MKIECFYEDTYKKYMEEWKKDHPKEDYNDWIKKKKKINERKYVQYMGSMGLYGTELGSILSNKYLNF